MEASPSLDEIRDLIVIGSKILTQNGVLDSFGHVSARHSENPDRFLMSIRKSPDMVEPEDIREFNLQCLLVGPEAPVFLERFIHGAIYAARPDVHSIVHSHSPGAVTLSTVKSQPLRAICNTSAFLGTSVPNFEIRDFAGDGTALLISNIELGQALAKSLGPQSAILMRGHGSTVVANSVQNAVYRAVYTERNAQMQVNALAIGEVTFMSEAEARAGAQLMVKHDERAWQSWLREVSA